MLIAARNAFMAGKRWKNPYVTNGLIAMWDGEWNAGGGVHDSTATTWKNLVPNSPFGNGERAGSNLVSDVVWTSQSCYPADTYTANAWRCCFNVSVALADTLAVLCGETVARIRAYNGDGWSASAAMGCDIRLAASATNRVRPAATFAYSSTQYQFWDCVQNAAVVSLDPTVLRSYHVRRDGSGLGLRINGGAEVVGGKGGGVTKTIGDVFPLILVGVSAPEVCCIRYYSRALTADEIAHNYAIDKARFNLP